MRNIKFIVLSALLFTGGAFTSCNKTSYDVMVVGVNNGKGWEETSVLIGSLENKKEEKIDNISFHIGKIDNKQVVVAESPIGTSEAAMTTTIGIKQYHPKYVISEGTAGGHHEQAKIFDIILGENIYDVASFEGPADHPLQWTGQYKGLQHPILHSDESLLNIAKNIEEYERGDIKADGGISSSDCWNKGKDFVNELREKLGEDCEEMESYAVANVCGHYKIPSLAIRIISNNMYIEDLANEGEIKLAQIYVQEYTIDAIKAI